MKLNLKGITVDTVARTVFLLVSLINGLCGVVGWTKLDIDENTVYTVVSGLAVVVSAVWGFWKNNSFTLSAQIGDEVKQSINDGEVEVEDITFVDEEELPFDDDDIETVEEPTK